MRIAILGSGVVGSSVAQLVIEDGHTVTSLADSRSAVIDPQGINVTETLERKKTEGTVGTATIESALNSTYDVLVEATPTTLGDAQPAFRHIIAALEQDRHVVLANKGPVAQRYTNIRAQERTSDGEVLFGATVGGAMPVLSTIAEFGPAQVTAVRGVLNGVANFILSRMAAEGLDYKHILAEVQDLGVAEVDPSFDVEGTDTALKCTIIANLLTQDKREYTLADASITGIQNIPGSTLNLAQEDGQTIRLIGEISKGNVRVGPRVIPENSPLAVSGTLNAIQLETKHAGQLNISGRGAGGLETAKAVLIDIGRLD